jgi:hypothetical protein
MTRHMNHQVLKYMEVHAHAHMHLHKVFICIRAHMHECSCMHAHAYTRMHMLLHACCMHIGAHIHAGVLAKYVHVLHDPARAQETCKVCVHLDALYDIICTCFAYDLLISRFPCFPSRAHLLAAAAKAAATATAASTARPARA